MKRNPFLPAKRGEGTLHETITRLALEAVVRRGSVYAIQEAEWLLAEVRRAAAGGR